MALITWLKQSTAVDIGIGPFLDETDGKTAETALTLTQPDIRLKKNGAAWAQKNAVQTLSHEENGYYEVALDATDTNTLGHLVLAVHESGALPVRHDFLVVPANVYDAIVNEVAGAVPWLGIVDQGTAQSATATTLVLRAAAAFANDELVGAIILITGGSAGVGQTRSITDYVSSTDTATVDTWTTTPTGTITYKIFAGPPGSATSPAPSNVTQFGGVAGTFAAGIPEVKAASVAANAITATAIAADAITAAKVAADVTTEIQAGLATAAALTTVEGKVDTLLAADVTFKRATAVTAFMIYMQLTDGTPGTGLTVAAQISKDGGAFAGVGGAVTEVSNGWYKHDLTGTEMTADVVALKYTATGASQRNLMIKTQS